MSGDKATYFQHRVKCLNCGLHFVVCSDYKDWPRVGTTEQIQTRGGKNLDRIYCPECGTHGNKMVYRAQEVEGFIFQMVPGEAKELRLLDI